MKLAMFQMDIIPGEPSENCKKVATWAKEAATVHQADAIVLPELWTTAYTLEALADLAVEENNDTILSFLQEIAATHQLTVFGGSYAAKTKNGVVNRAVVITKDGETAEMYDKIHLVPMLQEPSYMAPGKQLPSLLHHQDMKAAVSICYDLRFPELFRPLAVDGANLFVIPAEWPAARARHWETLLTARAIENQAFVAGCNRAGSYNGTEFAGRSMIIDPLGNTVAKASNDQEETIVADIDFKLTAETRKNIPVFSSREPSLYRFS
ncbi:carbon-nitrogen family hydrolase [Bacillus piscicola]|uniref:carbon-nitrogen family hydrolase n=1 Tax=Bacillus piscicola TaxID=1632684 RepID=UPI001F09F2CA|nr:carbon-nitrogen family hydrolase [Bacillus piscicola]